MKLPASDKSAEEESADPAAEGRHGNNSNGNSSNHGNGVVNNQGSDNVRQQHEDAMFSAVDAFLNRSEQSYEQFLEGFTYLKPGQESSNMSQIDVGTGPLPPSVRQSLIQGGAPSPSIPSIPGLAAFLSAHRSTTNTSNPGGSIEEAVCSTGLVTDARVDAVAIALESAGKHETAQDDYLEEEVLEAGSSVPEMLLRPQNTENKPLVKVDNFIVDEEDGTHCTQSHEDEGDEEEDFEPYIASFGTASGRATDKVSTSEITKSENPGISQTFENQNTEQKHSESIVDADDHKDTDECSEIIVTEHATCSKCAPMEMSACLYDSTGMPISERAHAACCDEDSDSDGELVYDPRKNEPNVGEITDGECAGESHGPIVPNVQALNFSARELTATDTREYEPTNTEPSEKVTDSVEPFCLDEDFDYDNVILTPKYNAEEMAILQQAMQMNSQGT